MDVKMYWLLPLGNQNTLVVFVLLEPVWQSNNTLDNSKDLLHIFVHGSRKPGVPDAKNQGPVRGVDHKKSDSTTNVVLQPHAVPISIGDAIAWTRNASEAWVWSFSCSCQHLGELYWSLKKRPRHGWLKKCGLYVEENLPCLVALGRLYKESRTVHSIPLGNDQVKVGVEEVRDENAHILVPTQEVQLVGQALNTFVA